MLGSYPIYVDLPANDLARARDWYESKLGLSPIGQLGPGFLYASGGVPFHIYQTEAAGSARNTAASWIVPDLDRVVAHLRSRGVRFEEYAMGDKGPTTVDGVARQASGAATAWFKDSEGNVLGINQLPPGVSLSDGSTAEPVQ